MKSEYCDYRRYCVESPSPIWISLWSFYIYTLVRHHQMFGPYTGFRNLVHCFGKIWRSLSGYKSFRKSLNSDDLWWNFLVSRNKTAHSESNKFHIIDVKKKIIEVSVSRLVGCKWNKHASEKFDWRFSLLKAPLFSRLKNFERARLYAENKSWKVMGKNKYGVYSR